MTSAVGEFLRSRRARITPAQVGIVAGTQRRRVPGLRREELAQLAGVSADYYVRVEQGRSENVSDAVLDAIARVLQLDGVEREHLANLARPGRRARTARPRPRAVDPVLQRVLDAMLDVPAVVLGRRMDILAANPAAQAVFAVSDMAGHNGARHTFLDSRARSLYRNWPDVAREVVAHLRLEAGRFPSDPALASLIGDLSMGSAGFRRLWAHHDVLRKSAGVTEVAHPEVGDLSFSYRMLTMPANPDQVVATYTYEPGSPTHERMRLLLSWVAVSPTPADRMRPVS